MEETARGPGKRGKAEMGAYCNWHRKKLADVAEHEQEQCWEQGWKCEDCPYFGEKEERMDRLRMAEANYKNYHPINGVVEPDFLEYLKETFRKWQQYHKEGVALGSREIAKLSNVVEGARINSRFGFEKFANRFTDEEGQEWFSLLIYKNREEMEIDAEPLYLFATKIHR